MLSLESSKVSRRGRWAFWAAILPALFLFRLFFGLTKGFFLEDETQIFLIGLRHYATGAWPYFGPDVVWTRSEIPGALQGVLISVPLWIVPVPESPIVLLNLVSFGALAWFAWYICERVPQVPRWLVWGWLMLAPWTLNFGTHIINPSYVLAPALVFFIGFFEAVPVFRLGKIPTPVAFLMMGASLLATMQVHMSWPLLLPFAGLAWLSRWKQGVRALVADAAGFLVGALITGSLLLPTLFWHPSSGDAGGTLRNFRPHLVSLSVLVSIVARFFSFAGLEIWRFMAPDDGRRQMLLLRHLWIVPAAAIVWFAGILQPIWMLREWFRSQSALRDWRALKWLVAATVVLVYASYWFVTEPSQAHAFYVVAPIAFMFAAYCWAFIDSPRWRRAAAALLAVNLVFQTAQALIQRPVISLYRDRTVVATAIRLKQPEMLSHRREFAVDGGPPSLKDPSRPWDASKDVEFSNMTLRMGPRRVALWTITLRNTNPRVAYRDIFYQAHYRAAGGQDVVERHDYIRRVFQPGESATLEIIDGFVDAPFASAEIKVLAAEALLPLPR